MDVGVEFTHYRVIEHIGRGGMADVWSARDKRLNRTVAVKTIGRDLSQDTEPIKLFEKEAQTIAQLEHPHILPIYDFGEIDSQLYIVMRYVTGGSLEDLLSNGPLPTNEVLRQAKDIAAALDYAHSNKVIHLDLKPSNILMDSNQSAYLADFGLATVLGPEGRAANPGYGTLLYMAPEQLTSGEIDHRADIYAFAIMVFQMLTGELPFDATTSLALKQLQNQETLPETDKLGSDMAEALTPVLRRGTALDPNDRPSSMAELVEEIGEALEKVRDMGVPAVLLDIPSDFVGGPTVDLSSLETSPSQDNLEMREALDIYNRAKRAWAHGQGRFLLGVTDFMLMNDFYMRADVNGLAIDEPGLQMLLRGALEYDHEVDYWWNKQDVDNRRWVALHAVRSGNAPARVRAFYRLETIPDSDPPKIPNLVAQSLAVETDEAAKRAAIQVLGTRAKRDYPSGNYAAVRNPGLTGRLLTIRTREDIQVGAPSVWREVVYTDDIDELLAQMALDPTTPSVAELAARTIGRIRSLAAVKKIAEEQRKGTDGALRALALVRDEAPSLPSVVSPQGRFYAWIANTWRRLTIHPLHNVWRFVFAMLGATAAMAVQVFTTFRAEAIFNADRWGKTISIGLTFGLFTAILVLISGEFPTRLRGFWPWWARLVFSLVTGFLLGTFSWGAFTWFFFNYPPVWDVMAFAGLGTAIGFTLTAFFNLRGWVAFLLTAISTYIPIYIMFNWFWNNQLIIFSQQTFTQQVAILYYDFPEQIFTLAIPVVLLIALGGHALGIWRDIKTVLAYLRNRSS